MNIYRAIIVEAFPGRREYDSAVLDDGEKVYQLCLLKSCGIADYIEKEVIISIDGDEIEITEVGKEAEEEIIDSDDTE